MSKRENLKCPLFGVVCELDRRSLPTYEGVIKYFLLVQNRLCKKENKQNIGLSEIVDVVFETIRKLWISASLPIISDRAILKKIKCYYLKYQSILKVKSTLKIGLFKKNAKCLFDICSCKCPNFDSCICKKFRKIAESERAFLVDQRTSRRMFMVDSKEKVTLSSLFEKPNKPYIIKPLLTVSSEKKSPSTSLTNAKDSKNREDIIDEESSAEEQEKEDSDDDFVPQLYIERQYKSTTQMRVKLPSLAEAVRKSGISVRSASQVSCAILKDLKIISKDDNSKAVDKCKVQRALKRRQSELQKNDRHETCNLKSLFFDGRKDFTLEQHQKDGKFYRTSTTEEHVVLVEEPDAKYIGHISPTSSSAKSITQAIFDYFDRFGIVTNDLNAVGCDSTVVNTGFHGGVFTMVEKLLGRPVQWIICLLHVNELPLRHLFLHLDDTTTGPNSFSGPIGKKLPGCEQLPVVKFKRIKTQLPEVDPKILSKDQQYLLLICKAVESGKCSAEVANRRPGDLCHARWLTFASRILRLYIATRNPPKNLVILAQFVMKVYAPMWFTIKANPSCTQGAKHLWEEAKLTRYLTQNLRSVIDSALQRSAYFAHPENLLLAMLGDERKDVRKEAVSRILQIRHEASKKQHGLRTFKIPTLQFDATDYINIIDWKVCILSEPPLTAHFSEESLQNIVEVRLRPIPQIWKIPCHTQAVERMIKVVTEASSKVVGENARDGYVRTKLYAQKTLPSFSSKKNCT